MIRTLVAVGFLGLVSTEAQAATGLAWQWPDAGWRYHVVARVLSPQPVLLMAEFNTETRIREIQVDAVVHCVPAFRGKKATEVTCRVEDLALQVTPIPQDESTKWQALVDELDQRWSKSEAQLTLGADGRLRAFDVEGVDQDDPRLRANFQVMRLVMGRAFAAFDLGLPPKGDDQGKGAWTQSGTETTALLSLTGSFGDVRVLHKITGTSGANVTITTAGDGVITSDPSASAVNYFDTVYRGVAVFDTARGVLVERQYLARGELTASSPTAQGTTGIGYVQMVRMVLIEPGAALPVLPASGRLPPQ